MSNKNQFALTPPMGWNSWDCYGASVCEKEVRANAEYMAKNLKQYGWEYVVVDIQWYEPNAAGTLYNNLAKLCMDEYGRLIPAPNRFPSSAGGKGFAPLADYIHSLGLKMGIHVMRGIPRQAVYADCPVKGTKYTARDIADGGSICSWNTDMYGVIDSEGGQAYYDSIIQMYADWGIDFIKVDDMNGFSFMGSRFYHKEAEMIRRAIDKTGRPIVFSISPRTHSTESAELLIKNANMWRISDDFWDNWDSLKKMHDLLHMWNPYMGNGHFPDADMLPIWRLSVRSNDPNNRPRYTNLTRDEQYFMMSLWSIARSPLILGCELTELDDFSLSLITNTDMIALNQHSTNNRMIYRCDKWSVWAAEYGNDCVFVGFFNFSDQACAASVLFSDIGIQGRYSAVDVWSRRSYGICDELVAVKLNPHQGTLIKLTREM